MTDGFLSGQRRGRTGEVMDLFAPRHSIYYEALNALISFRRVMVAATVMVVQQTVL